MLFHSFAFDFTHKLSGFHGLQNKIFVWGMENGNGIEWKMEWNEYEKGMENRLPGIENTKNFITKNNITKIQKVSEEQLNTKRAVPY